MDKVASTTFGPDKDDMLSSQTCKGLPPTHHLSSTSWGSCRTLAEGLLRAELVGSNPQDVAALMSIQLAKGGTTPWADNSGGMQSDDQAPEKPTIPASSHPQQPKVIRSSAVQPIELGCSTSRQPTRGITLSIKGLAFSGGGVTLPNYCIQQAPGPKGVATPPSGRILEPSTTALPVRKVVTITSSTPRSIQLSNQNGNVHSPTNKALFNAQQLAMERRTNSAPGLISLRTTAESTGGVKTKYKYQKVFGGKQDVEPRKMSMVS